MAPSQFALEAQRWHPPRLIESGGQGKTLVCHTPDNIIIRHLFFQSTRCLFSCLPHTLSLLVLYIVLSQNMANYQPTSLVIPLTDVNYEISGCECLKIGKLSKRLEVIHLRRSCFGD